MTVRKFEAIVDVLSDVHLENFFVICFQNRENKQSIFRSLRLKVFEFKTRAQNPLHDLVEFDFTVPRFPMRGGGNVIGEGFSENLLS